MKILFFIDSLGAGGKERRLIELMKQLRSGYDIQFELVLMNSDIHYKEVFDFGIKIHYLIRTRRKDFSVFKKLYALCKDFKPDFLHCWDSMTAVYCVPVCKLLHIRLVNGMITDAPIKQNLNNKRWLRARLTFPFSDVVIGNSLAGLRAYHAPKNKSVCIYNGFNFDRLMKIEDVDAVRSKFNIKAKYVVLMVGAFEERKDYESYIDAAKLVCDKRSDIEFIAVGEGENFDRISRKIAPSCSHSIKLVGNQLNVESIINISDICVLMTNHKVHGEGISNSILEYMAMGKAVIASSGGGTNEIIENNRTGFLINPSSPQELSEKIGVLIENIELRKTMGIAGRQRIEDYFSINSMVDKFVQIYKNFRLNSAVVNQEVTSKNKII
jgi:glycosyltransferase involved in cell wall biosynthesis